MIRIITTLLLGVLLYGCQSSMDSRFDEFQRQDGEDVFVYESLDCHQHPDVCKQTKFINKMNVIRHIETNAETILIPADVIFKPGSDQFTEQGPNVLNKVLRLIYRDHGAKKITIQAGTSVSAKGFAKVLTQHQADHIQAYFWAQGIQWNRMTAKGLGIQISPAPNVDLKDFMQVRMIQITLR
ncbi:hypothetical protein N9Y17_00310 [Gammaproteobacteria bacterium]|nr:hypothetical protein [Gammaproteobacteria bacterium]